jgi:hypothetical protein
MHDTLRVENNRALSEQLRTSFDEFLQTHKEFNRSNKSGLSIGFRKLSIGGSNDYNTHQINDLLWKLHDDRDYVLSDNETFTLQLKVSNKDVVDAWRDCILNISGGGSRIRLVEMEGTAETVHVRASIPQTLQNARVQAVTIRGGTFDGLPPAQGTALRDNDQFFVHRNGGEEMLFAIKTTAGTAAILKEKVTPPTPQKGDTSVEDAARKKRDEELAELKKTHTIWAGKEDRGQMKQSGTTDTLKRSEHFCFRKEDHFCGFITFYGGNPARPHNIACLIRHPDGTVTPTAPLLSGEGHKWALDNPKATNHVWTANPDVVIHALKDYYKGKDFDGWVFEVTGGDGLSARLAGAEAHPLPAHVRDIERPIADPYVMPPLNPGYEWELASVKVDGWRWLNGAEFTFRVCFTDRDRKITPAPDVVPATTK